MSDTDWYQNEAGQWEKVLGQFDSIYFTDDEIADWPPLVALRNDIARLRKAIEAHRDDFRKAHYTGSTSWECDEVLWAALDHTDKDTP